MSKIPYQSETLVALQTALWSDPGLRTGRMREVMTEYGALKPDANISELVQSLLKASEQDVMSNRNIASPFYRLSNEDRLVLSLLHLRKWNYDDLATVLHYQNTQIEEVAWRARMHLAANAKVNQVLLVPAGSQISSANCPEYSPYKPWTQKLLDDQMQPNEKIFIQGHLRDCQNCRLAFTRAKDFYHAVEAWVPRPTDFKSDKDFLMKSWRHARLVTHPVEMTLKESLQIFLSRSETRWTLGILFFLFISIYATQALSQ